jgi:hypothetical protein
MILHCLLSFLFHFVGVFIAPELFFLLTGHVLLRQLYVGSRWPPTLSTDRKAGTGHQRQERDKIVRKCRKEQSPFERQQKQDKQ